MPRRIHLWKHIHLCQFWAGPKHLTRKLKVARTKDHYQGLTLSEVHRVTVIPNLPRMAFLSNEKSRAGHLRDPSSVEGSLSVTQLWNRRCHLILTTRYILHKSPSKSLSKEKDPSSTVQEQTWQTKKAQKVSTTDPSSFFTLFLQGLPWMFLTTWAYNDDLKLLLWWMMSSNKNTPLP